MRQHGKEFDENKYLLDYFNTLSKDLIRTQQEAAKNSKGFKDALLTIKDTYGNPTWEKFYSRHFNIDVGVKPAKTAEQLKAQLLAVKGNTWERHYVEQKLILRHVMSLLEERGMAKQVVDKSFAGQFLHRGGEGIQVSIMSLKQFGVTVMSQIFRSGFSIQRTPGYRGGTHSPSLRKSLFWTKFHRRRLRG